MQSPISLRAAEAKKDSSLQPLEFNHQWNERSSGVFKNVGHTVQFTPEESLSLTVTNMCGTYKLLQFHLHWGSGVGKGSEHALTVIGVLLDEDSSGEKAGASWTQLDVDQIQQQGSLPVSTPALNLTDFLPDNRSYYYYQGSLTTPPYSEVVQWFVMKERIPVPSGFLEQLRKLQSEEGTAIRENFRALQPLGNRAVSFYNDGL